MATGSELSLAVAAYEELAAAGIAARVVSMPSFELFDEQDAAYRDQVLPPAVTARVAVEAGIRQGWDRYLGPQRRLRRHERLRRLGAREDRLREDGHHRRPRRRRGQAPPGQMSAIMSDDSPHTTLAQLRTSTMPNDVIPIPGFADPFSSLSHLVGAGVFLLLSVLPHPPRPRRLGSRRQPGHLRRRQRAACSRSAASTTCSIPTATAAPGHAGARPRRDLHPHRLLVHADRTSSCSAAGDAGAC